jgi:hypothetical protein
MTVRPGPPAGAERPWALIGSGGRLEPTQSKCQWMKEWSV